MAEDIEDQHPDLPFLRFDSIVGRGGMAVVWKAWHRELRRFVAVKVLGSDFSASERDVAQFMSEVRTMTNIDHPGLVRGYGADCAGGRYYFIMDFVDGYTFASLQKRKHHIQQEDAVIICESVATAMRYAWQNFWLVHCDIKPDNIMVDRDGTVRILDLGICQSTMAIRGEKRSDEVVGTPAYISPEQIYGDCKLDCRADIYCLGATLYHLVAGRTLFPLLSSEDTLRAHVDPERQAPDPRRFNPGLSEDFVRLLAGMLVKDRNWRYPTWGELYDAVSILDRGGIIPPLPDEAVSSLAVDL